MEMSIAKLDLGLLQSESVNHIHFGFILACNCIPTWAQFADPVQSMKPLGRSSSG